MRNFTSGIGFGVWFFGKLILSLAVSYFYRLQYFCYIFQVPNLVAEHTCVFCKISVWVFELGLCATVGEWRRKRKKQQTVVCFLGKEWIPAEGMVLGKGENGEWWSWALSLLVFTESCKTVGTVTHFLTEESKITGVSSEPLLLSTTLLTYDIFSLLLLEQACWTTLNVSQLAYLLWKTLGVRSVLPCLRS